ncbi:MAG: hypothetical protein HC840_10485 [Leptolyngbyaceae cyanobacterium RM2_2_4]|nr:hypothetical protein [Leptolyngbyaceae cyanobacterium RM2_2_4]
MNTSIKQMAEIYYRSGFFRSNIRDIIRKKNPSKTDEETLLKFCLECQKQQMSRGANNGMTIKEMKNTIMNIIGRPDLVSNGYQATVNRKELQAMLEFVMNLPAEYLKDLDATPKRNDDDDDDEELFEDN